jgi:hypothetical protein
MVRLYLLSVIVLNLFFATTTSAQNDEKRFYEAEDLIEYDNFHKALSIYLDLLNTSPNNANLNFKVGFCYLNTATDKIKAIPYLEFASKHINLDYKYGDFSETTAPIESLYFLGKAYHVNYRFNDAESVFIKLKSMLDANNQEFADKINHKLEACQVARNLMKDPVDMNVTNLGSKINTIYSEHSPVISGDESILVFTSKRKGNTGGRKTDDGQYFEDIYISSFDGKQYTQAVKISDKINTSNHEASIGLSFDGTKLLIYKDGENEGDIYISNRKGSTWSEPERLPEPINSKYRETHATISFDNAEIYFTSDRKGGYGGLDIYRVKKLPNGKWSKALNLGPTINTKYNEEGPYLHPDGTSLYFASEGHNTMGGFDIFVSFRTENGEWSLPQNIGYPINTPDDDVFYVPSVDGRRAYYSSYANNSIGNFDIFRIDLSESHVRNQTVIAGIASDNHGEVLQDAIITITDMDDEVIGVYTPNEETGKFLFILPRGKTFNVLFESSNSDEQEYTINVPNYSYDQTKRVIPFDIIVIRDEKEPEITFTSLSKEKQVSINNTDSMAVNDKNETTISDFKKDTVAEKKKVSELLVSTELFNDKKYINSDSVNSEQNNKDKEKTDNYKSQNKNLVSVSEKRYTSSYIIGALFFAGLLIFFIYRKKRKNKQ